MSRSWFFKKTPDWSRGARLRCKKKCRPLCLSRTFSGLEANRSGLQIQWSSTTSTEASLAKARLRLVAARAPRSDFDKKLIFLVGAWIRSRPKKSRNFCLKSDLQATQKQVWPQRHLPYLPKRGSQRARPKRRHDRPQQSRSDQNKSAPYSKRRHQVSLSAHTKSVHNAKNRKTRANRRDVN